MKKIIYLLFLLLSQSALSQLNRDTQYLLDGHGNYWYQSNIYLSSIEVNVPKSIQSIIDLNINEIRGNDTTGGGCSDYDSTYVRTVGVVYGQNFGQSNSRIQLSLIDKRADTILSNRCGIGLFKANQSLPVSLNEGDSIVVIGLVTCFNGLSQINIDSVRVLKTGSQLIQPRVVTNLSEISESYLIKLKNVQFVPSSWPVSPGTSGFTARVTDGTQEIDIRIDNDCDLYGSSMPTGNVDVVGLGGQFDTSIPRDSRYQLLPRTSSDITPAEPLVLPEFYFEDTVHTVTEGTVYSLTIKSTQPVNSQLSCLVYAQNGTTDSTDYLSVPLPATFPVGTSTTNYVFTVLDDNISEFDEYFYIRLKKLTDGYKLGSDSIAKIKIPGTTSVKQLQSFDIYKSFNGTVNINLPQNFKGNLNVYNSFGQLIMSSKDDRINKDLEKLNQYPSCVYRLVLDFNKKIIVKTIIN
jgi:hypothetical protein